MSTNTVDWSTLTADPDSATSVAALEALARGFDPGVPTVLIPVRVETRFATAEVPDRGEQVADLIARLRDVAAALQRFAKLPHATTLPGGVRARRKFKDEVEKPLYADIAATLAAVEAGGDALRLALEQPITSATPQQAKALSAAMAQVRSAGEAALPAVATLRSDYQRALFTESLGARLTTIDKHLAAIGSKVEPGLRLVAELGITTGTLAARELGRAPDGRPLRPDLRPDLSANLRPDLRPALRPDLRPELRSAAAGVVSRRVIVDDGTPAAALGAQRVVRIEHAQLVAAAESAERIRTRLADDTAEIGPDLVAEAAGILLLPGSLKADLLTALDKAGRRRPGTAELRAEIAATPSDHPELDGTVPERAAGTVWAVADRTRTVHQLLVRIYPEPLAVDSHEDALTDTERAAGAAFWSEWATAGSNTELRKGAWRALCIGRSTRRAAWIARVSEPVAPAPTAGAPAAARILDAIAATEKRLAELDAGRRPLVPGERTPRLPVPRGDRQLAPRQVAAMERALRMLGEAVKVAPALPAASGPAIVARLRALQAAVVALGNTFADVPPDWAQSLEQMARRIGKLPVEPPPEPVGLDGKTRSGTWTRAASSTVLPSRFAVIAVRDGRATRIAAGNPVPPGLALGLDPKGDTFTVDDGALVVPDSIKWMTDFDAAVANGMALRIAITPDEAEHGFDELLVVGLAAGDTNDGVDRLTAMLDAHHYTGAGLSLVPVGTPTNNTEDESSGHSTNDDPDAAFGIELGADLAAAVPDSDGRRLAAALGVDPATLAHVRGADGTDAADALTTNRALYPGTIGHALEELAPGLVGREARGRLRAYALTDVAGRSLLPAVRVDDEPYGVLPAVATSRFRPDVRDAGVDPASAQASAQRRFEDTFLGLLRHLHADWSAMREGSDGGPAVKHFASPEVGRPGFDAQRHFLAMLGLEPSSVGASYRFAVNVADRGGVRGEPDLGLGFGIPPRDGVAVDPSAEFGPFGLLEHLEDVFRTGLGLPATPPRDPDTGRVAVGWVDVYDALVASRAYGLRLLTGLHPLRGVVAAASGGGSAGTGSWIVGLLGRSLEELRARTEQDLRNVGLAELFARQALLAEARRAAADILVERGVLSDAEVAVIGTSSLYQAWSAGTLSRTSAWGLLFDSVDGLVRVTGSAAAVPADLIGRTMAQVLQAARPASVDDHRAAVARFANLPAARMTALTREHLDLATHRLDAWIGGLAHRRMRTMRQRRPGGVHVGAYGWVENLRPKPTAPAASGVPAALAGMPGRPVVRDESGKGFIQTPSPTHAVTAAVLRAAYVSQTAEGSFGNEMSVNLSSNRVRVALSLIDGVRAGNDLGALLGYRLERFLHEYYARPDTPHVVELDSAIFPLRDAYPTVAAVDPGADAAKERTRYVVDGLALVRTILDWIQGHAPTATGTLFQVLNARMDAHPWGVAAGALPPKTDMDRLTGVLRGIDAIADALDALGDLTTSEAVHQLVRGNHTRAAAVLAALGEGTAIPHPEVADTPRTGLPVTHRLLLSLPPVPAEPVASPAGWEAVPMTPRAAVEPAVNAWLAGLLGDPALIRVRLTSDRLAPGAALPEASVADLGLQPLDLVALLADGFDSAVGSLAARVLDRERPADLPPDQPGVVVSDGPQTTATDAWRIESRRAAAWGPSIRSIADVAPLLEACADLLGRAKPARASDFAAPEVTAVAGDGVDVADLAVRVQRLLDDARRDAVALARLLGDDPTLDASVLATEPAVWLATLRVRQPGDPDAEHPSAWLPALDISGGTAEEVAAALARLDGFWGRREAWRTATASAQHYGIRVGLPRRFLSRIQVGTELLQSAEVAFVDLASRCRAAGAVLDGAADPKPAGTWTDAARALLGDAMTLVPRIGVDPVRAELETALDAGLVPAHEVDAWLEGAAAVRPGAADLADLQVLAEALGRGAPTATVAQLPHSAGEPWLGGRLPDPTAINGKVSVVVYGREHLPSAGASGTALLVDEWSESVPFREEMTGVALHYDQPDATAPQAILVAVPPVLDTPWTLTDFAATLHDTLELARNRTVELEHIGARRYGQFLPLLVGEVVPRAADAGVAGDRVILDFHQNNP